MDVVYSDVNPNYGVSTRGEIVTNIESINASIENILGTSKGERVFLPEFGSSISSLLFDPISEDTASAILTLLITAIDQWEPRIKVILSRSSVIPDYDNNYYEVFLVYKVIGLGVDGTFNRAIQVQII